MPAAIRDQRASEEQHVEDVEDMAVPDYQSIMLPLLKIVSGGQQHTIREVINALAEQFELSHESHESRLPDSNIYPSCAWFYHCRRTLSAPVIRCEIALI
ncbi:MAG: winged helix-turn-helix domain-containing protein [Bacteroidota bacterium]